MKIKLNKIYKSIISLPEDIEFPPFVVLTGLNGSGKTQFLEGINNGCINLFNGVIKLEGDTLYTHETFKPKQIEISRKDVENQRNDIINDLDKQIKKYKEFRKNDKNGKFNFGFKDILDKILINSKIEIENLTSQDLRTFYPLDDKFNKTNIFQYNFETLFKDYQVKILKNNFNNFLIQQGRKNIEYLDDKKFIELYGEAPWDIFNKIIKEVNFGYQLNYPSFSDQIETPFQLKLINMSGDEISINDLSFGEKRECQ